MKNFDLGMIVASDINNLIGYNSSIPWYNKTDLNRFKDLTQNSVVIMGRKTYDSLPVGKKTGTKLHGRMKVVLSSHPHPNSDDTKWVTNINDAIVECNKLHIKQIYNHFWLIGGATLYKEALETNLVDYIDHTVLNMMYLGNDSMKDFQNKKVMLMPIPNSYQLISDKQSDEDPILWHRRYSKRPNLHGKSWLPEGINNAADIKKAEGEFKPGQIKMITNENKTMLFGYE